VITTTVLELPDGTRRALGDWCVRDLTGNTIAQFQRARRTVVVGAAKTKGRTPKQSGGAVAANRNLTFLRSAFNWAIEEGLVERNPFVSTRKRRLTSEEPPRSRRLEAGEGERLLRTAGPHLRALVEAALETGCRKGELLSLQWSQVRLDGRPELSLPAQKTKTGKPRTVPISVRLMSILAMRRIAPDGTPHPGTAYLFGNEIGQRVTTVKTAWRLACKRARIEGLHFHDLRREAGSRWLEGGVPLHTVRAWLGHSNISQTSTYFATTFEAQHDVMRALRRATCQLATTCNGFRNRGANSATIRHRGIRNYSGKHHRR
jgi:integrase